MVDFAEHQFKLVKPAKDGTLRDHLEQIYKQTGRKPKELEGPEFPHLMSYVWSAFLQLNDARTMSQHTANPISYVDIKAYIDVTHTVLSSRDIETIKELDKVYLRIMNQKSE